MNEKFSKYWAHPGVEEVPAWAVEVRRCEPTTYVLIQGSVLHLNATTREEWPTPREIRNLIRYESRWPLYRLEGRIAWALGMIYGARNPSLRTVWAAVNLLDHCATDLHTRVRNLRAVYGLYDVAGNQLPQAASSNPGPSTPAH